jgi:hypothetical protein
VALGEKTGALPSGRMAGQPFAASLGAVNGCDRLGPTALLIIDHSCDSICKRFVILMTKLATIP